jgi:ceroid-lipofuscinosis MFS transporter 7
MQQPGDANQDVSPSDGAKIEMTPYVSMEEGDDPSPTEDKFEDEAAYFDDEDLSLSPSIVESVMTADGIEDVPGFYVVCLVILVGDMSRGVFFPSMWPLVESLGGSSVTLGYCVASFSFGRILVSPLFGRLSVTYGYSKILLLSCSILLFGTFLYGQVQNVGRPEFLIVAQTVLGLGSGTLGVTRAFVAEVTAQRNRTTYMAWITAVQYAGFTVTPFVGAIFIKTLGDYDFKFGCVFKFGCSVRGDVPFSISNLELFLFFFVDSIFRWNMYTAPAYFMSLVIIMTIVSMRLFFKDRVRIATTKELKKSKKREAIDDQANQKTWIGLTVYDCCIAGCMLLNIATKGSISSFETLGVSIAESHFDMTSSQAGTTVASCGTVGVMALLSMGYLAKYFSDIQLICGGMVVMASGILSLTFVDDDADNSGWRFFFAIFLIYAIGYPIGHTAVIGLFSKSKYTIDHRRYFWLNTGKFSFLLACFFSLLFSVVGRRPQGELLGWFASAGSLARLFFPIMSGYVANYLGITTLFWVLTGILGVSTGFSLYNKQTLEFLSG